MTVPVRAKVEAQGNRLTVKRMEAYRVEERKNGNSLRGIISGFSEKSRKRLIDLMASIDCKLIDKDKKPLFVTLTYKKNQTDAGYAKRDLKVFIQRLRYHYPECGIVWRMEWQERGAVHFHLIIFNVGFIPIHTRADGVKGIQNHWNEVSGESVKNSVDVTALKSINSMNGVMYYVSKYLAKEDTTEHTEDVEFNAAQTECADDDSPMGLSIRHTRRQRTGRMWGVSGKENLPLGDLVQFEIVCDESSWSWFLDRLNSVHTKRDYSFTVYSNDAISLAMVFHKRRTHRMARTQAHHKHSVTHVRGDRCAYSRKRYMESAHHEALNRAWVFIPGQDFNCEPF